MLNDLLGRGAPMPWLSKRPAARFMLARWRFQGAYLGEVTLKDPSADTSGITDRNDYYYITLTIEAKFGYGGRAIPA